MTNNRPPGGNRPPGRNRPPANSSFFGNRPAINNGLNANSGFTWTNPKQNPLSPQFVPPKSSLVSGRLPKFSPIARGGLGLGKVAGGLWGGLPGIALIVALAVLETWLDQQASPPSTIAPESVGTFPLDPAKSYTVITSAQIQNAGNPANVRSAIGQTHSISSGFLKITSISFEKNGQLYQHAFYAVAISGNGVRYGVEPSVISPEAWQSKSATMTVIENQTNKEITPVLAPPSSSPPPYSLARNNQSNPLIKIPDNPTPFNPPQKNPLFTPSFNPKTPLSPTSPTDEDDLDPPFWFVPNSDYLPPDFPELFPTVRRYTVSDPVLEASRKVRDRSPIQLKNPFSSPSSTTTPGVTPATTPTTTPTTPSTSRSTTPTTTPATTPTTPGSRSKEDKTTLFPPLLITNPQDPQIKSSEQSPTPVNQSPAGNNCCAPTSTNTKLDEMKNQLDYITPALQLADLALLKVINAKLGPQVNGGLSGYLQDRFTKLWNSRVVDRALNLMTMAASIHNAVMLSRNIGSTLIATLGNALSIIGIKDGDEVAQNFSSVIGDGIENIIKGLIGTENYTQLSETWAKANRIYQSAINLYQLTTDSLFGITSGLEQTAKYTGKIGNALRKSGVVLENSYNWMAEQFNFTSGKNRKIDRVIQGLQQASEVASDLESITSEFRSVTENVAEISTQVNTIKTEINGKEETKKNSEDISKSSSQSPQINKSDLNKPDT